MKLPNGENGIVELEKVRDYLLNPSHPDGGSKAQFFTAMGFRREEWQTLAGALYRLVRDFSVRESMTSPHGQKYIVDGVLLTPNGQTPTVRTVWIIDADSEIPRLVTAYPKE